MANLPWVTKLARAQRPTAVSEEDLFQEGVCGLLKAIDRFEAERGLRLMTYATWYIREAMQQIRARQSHLVALSSHDQTLLGQLEVQRTAFQHRHERLPSVKELGQSVRVNPRSISRLQMIANPAISLERSGTEGSIPVPIDDPAHEFDRMEEIQTTVSRLLETLPTRERLIVTRRFGLDGKEPTSLEVLGGDLNVSKERVRQLQRQAIRRMQEQALEEEVGSAAV
jgi:RNA polymerase sigma factor (sigma-70 family)